MPVKHAEMPGVRQAGTPALPDSIYELQSFGRTGLRACQKSTKARCFINCSRVPACHRLCLNQEIEDYSVKRYDHRVKKAQVKQTDDDEYAVAFHTDIDFSQFRREDSGYYS